MTRAIRLHRSSGPEALEVGEIELPAPKADEALVCPQAIGMNATSGAPAACASPRFQAIRSTRLTV